MQLKPGFIVHDIGGEHMAAAAGEASRSFNGLIRNNETADFIYRQLLQPTTEQAIVDAMAERYNAPREQIASDVAELLAKLRKANLLDE